MICKEANPVPFSAREAINLWYPSTIINESSCCTSHHGSSDCEPTTPRVGSVYLTQSPRSSDSDNALTCKSLLFSSSQLSSILQGLPFVESCFQNFSFGHMVVRVSGWVDGSKLVEAKHFSLKNAWYENSTHALSRARKTMSVVMRSMSSRDFLTSWRGLAFLSICRPSLLSNIVHIVISAKLSNTS